MKKLNKIINKKIRIINKLFLFMILLPANNLISQIVFGYGTPRIYNETPSALIGIRQLPVAELSYKILGLHTRINEKLSIENSLFSYRGSTYFYYGKAFSNDKSKGTIAEGYFGTILNRNDLIAKWKILTPFSFLSLKAILGAGFVNSEVNGASPSKRFWLSSSTDYVQTDDVKADHYSNSQWIPITGFELDTRIWIFDIFLNTNFTKGFKTHQRLILPYSFQGIKQPPAISENRGSGIFLTFGVRTNILQPKFDEEGDN